MEAALIVGGVVVVGAVAFVFWKIEQKRRQALAAFATSKGLRYKERDDSVVSRFTKLGDPFDRGFDREARNVMSGKWDGRQAVAWDFRYHTWETKRDSDGHSRREKEDHNMFVVAVTSGHDFPDLSVRPEGFLGRTVGRMTGSDIELESEDFNRAFTVTCEDRKFASDVLHPRMMEALLGYRDIGWTFNKDWILAYEEGRHTLAELERRLGALDAVLDGIPEFVWREAKGPTP